jgi:hypothetical protein
MTTSKAQVMDVDFTGVVEEVIKERIKPGEYEEFKISGVEFGVADNDKKTPYVNITVNVGELQHTDKFYLTSKALPKLKHMLRNCGIDPALLETKMSTADFERIVIGRSFRGIMGGREFLNEEGQTRIAPQFPFRGFAEPVGSNNLKFDPAKHIERLKNPNATSSQAGTEIGMETDSNTLEAPADDLPF